MFYDGDTVFRTPIGLSLGRRFDSSGSGMSFVPYLQPVLIPTFSDGDSSLDFALGLGLDIRLARRFDLRVERVSRRPRGLRGQLRLGAASRRQPREAKWALAASVSFGRTSKTSPRMP